MAVNFSVVQIPVDVPVEYTTTTYRLVSQTDLAAIVFLYLVLYISYFYGRRTGTEVYLFRRKIKLEKLILFLIIGFSLAVIATVLYNYINYADGFVQVCDRLTGECTK